MMLWLAGCLWIPAEEAKSELVTDLDGDGWTTGEGDCDDGDDDVYPGADESDCSDPVDYNCDGSTGADDHDGDGLSGCEDCDDGDAAKDGPRDWYADGDGDGYGDAGDLLASCVAPDGYVRDSADCDDSRAEANPGAAEMCNGEDDDCDASVDEDAVDTLVWYADEDGDGFGAGEIEACDEPDGSVATGGDCDDGRAEVFPGAAEYCNLVDDDCDGEDDEGAVDVGVWYVDGDGDGFGDGEVEACERPVGSAVVAGDCDDGDGTIHPGATESCVTADDDDCDGVTNEEDAAACTAYYADADGDGFGDGAVARCGCAELAPYVTLDASDCDDADAAVSPAETEVCDNGVDDDCDGGAGDCGISGTVTAADFTLTGVEAGELAGYSVSGGGDIDGDGLDDVVVGAPYNADVAADAGRVYGIVGGVSSGSVGSAPTRTAGIVGGERVGISISADGDADGDGLADALIGGNGYDCNANDCGLAFVVTGPAFDADWTRSPIYYQDYGCAYANYAGESKAGSSTSFIGDLDGSGSDEVAFGAPGADSGAGRVYVDLNPSSVCLYSGLAGRLSGESSGDQAGFSIAGVGDTDGDGLDDLLVGASGAGADAGAAYVVLAPEEATATLASADTKHTGEAVGDYAGWDVATAGDVNADGYADSLVGAAFSNAGGTSAGRAYLLLGPPASGSLAFADLIITGSAGDYLGGDLAGVGDIDRDGADDLGFGLPTVDAYTGAVYVFTGSPTGSLTVADATAELTGHSAGQYFGSSLAAVGDVDGDSFDDIIVGAPHDDSGATDAGAAYIYLGGSF